MCKSSQGQKCIGSVVCDKLLNLRAKLITMKPFSQLFFLLLCLLTHFPGFIFTAPDVFPSGYQLHQAHHHSTSHVYTQLAFVFVFANLDSETENTALHRMCMSSLGFVFGLFSLRIHLELLMHWPRCKHDQCQSNWAIVSTEDWQVYHLLWLLL